MAVQIPEQISAALADALQARLDVDAATVAKDNTDASLATSKQLADAADADLTIKTSVLDAKRKALEAIEDTFLQPGGTLQVPTAPPTP